MIDFDKFAHPPGRLKHEFKSPLAFFGLLLVTTFLLLIYVGPLNGISGFFTQKESERLSSAETNCSIADNVDSEELEFLRIINNHRQQNGLGPLAISPTLTKSAAWKSKDMAEYGYFSHDDTGGAVRRTWVERIRQCGYTYNAWLGENIAAGNSTAQATFNQWLNSPGHNANMLGENYTVIGIGRYYKADSRYGWYWTNDFASYNDSAVPTPTPTPTPIPTPTPAPGCTMLNPTVSLSPTSQTSSAGGSQSYTLTVRNNNTSACTNSTFNLNATVPAGWLRELTPATLTLASGTTGNSTLRVTSSASAAANSYNIIARATNSSAVTYTVSAQATYVISPATVGIDTDRDGCTDSRELGSNQFTGGRRNPNYFWDFYDTPNASNVRDKVITIEDLNRIKARFGKNDNNGTAAINRNTDPLSAPPLTGYHPAFDRTSPAAGTDPWDTRQPDGIISVADLNLLIAQFGHSCL